MIPSALINAFSSANLAGLQELIDALENALKRTTNSNVKRLRCLTRRDCNTERERNVFIKFAAKHNLETSSSYQERLSFLWILNDLLYWGGDGGPSDLRRSIQAVALSSFRAALYAPDVGERTTEVHGLLGIWKERKYFEPIAFSGLQAGLMVPPKQDQYDFHAGPAVEKTNDAIPTQIQLGRPDQQWWELPVSTMLPLLRSYEEKCELGLNELDEIAVDRCAPMQVYIRKEHIDAMNGLFPSTHSFPELEEDEESKLAYEGWNEAFWARRRELV